MLRIHAFAGLAVRADGRPLAGAAAQPRRLAILAMLARAGDRGLTREKLLSVLWPDATEDRGRRTLAQALYALRRDLDSDDAVTGTKELRLDPDLVSSDVADFELALAHGRHERAAELYVGPFLDGFHVPGGADFSRWVDDERSALAHQYVVTLERLARADAGRDGSAAVGWWRKLAAIDPLNARVSVGLMEALAATGDRAGALRHARIYEVLLEQALDVAPDQSVVALANRLRQAPGEWTPAGEPVPDRAAPSPVDYQSGVATLVSAPASATPLPRDVTASPSGASGSLVVSPPEMAIVTASATPAVSLAPSFPTIEPSGHADTSAPGRGNDRQAVSRLPTLGAMGSWWRLVAVLMTLAVATGVLLRASGRWGAGSASPTADVVVAVGRIATYRVDSSGVQLAVPVGDLLATNLARAPGLRVISAVRMAEVLRESGDGRDTSLGAFTAAARLAGATELVDGTLYAMGGDRMRLDLRRVDLASGEVRSTHTVQGADVFALVDSGTARLVAPLGRIAPVGPVADVTTRSLVAYRLYREGLDRFYALDDAGAARLFRAALDEDSAFAMAAWYLSQSLPGAAGDSMLVRAIRLARGATDRERLSIQAGWAIHMSSPALAAIADTLATRYPDEVEGHFYRGHARVAAQDFVAALAPLQRVIEMDSAGFGEPRRRCLGCDAMRDIVYAYHALDSVKAAVREAQRWTRLQPASGVAWLLLADVLDAGGESERAVAAIHHAGSVDPSLRGVVSTFLAMHAIKVSDYATADRLLLAQAESGTPGDGSDAAWYLALSARQQGRLADALVVARREASSRPVTPAEHRASHGSADPSSIFIAQLLAESGQARAAAALFDSIGRWTPPGVAASALARNRVWAMTHAADALAGAGDSADLARRIPIVQSLGAASFQGRDHRLSRHIAGLLLAARGRDAEAATELRAAIGSLTLGYTRSNLALARVLLRLARPSDAVAVLQPALRGAIDGSNAYVSRTELHEALALAWRLVGRPDSAAAHDRVVARDWARGDPPFALRAAAAAARVSSGELAARP